MQKHRLPAPAICYWFELRPTNRCTKASSPSPANNIACVDGSGTAAAPLSVNTLSDGSTDVDRTQRLALLTALSLRFTVTCHVWFGCRTGRSHSSAISTSHPPAAQLLLPSASPFAEPILLTSVFPAERANSSRLSGSPAAFGEAKPPSLAVSSALGTGRLAPPSGCATAMKRRSVNGKLSRLVME